MCVTVLANLTAERQKESGILGYTDNRMIYFKLVKISYFISDAFIYCSSLFLETIYENKRVKLRKKWGWRSS